MKEILYSLVFVVLSAALFACGDNDEPDVVQPDEITRVQDGNGKVFLENGVLVDGNIDYTSADLNKALAEYEWVSEYGFYYDNTHVSSKQELNYFMPTHIHIDGTIEYSSFPKPEGRIQDYSIVGKKLSTTPRKEMHSSYLIPSQNYVIVALDLSGDGQGRMILDYKASIQSDGYDPNSSWVRMVWRALPSSE